MINPAQNAGSYSVIVNVPAIGRMSLEPGQGEMDGTLSPLAQSTSGFGTEVPRITLQLDSTEGAGSPISKDMSVLRTHYASIETSVSGVREVADRRFA